jgi:small subunit ribosomal protein S19
MEIRKKEFRFRGKTLEELKALDVREFAKLLRSRQRRTVLRQFQKIEDFVNRSKVKLSRKKPIKTHQRDLIIVPHMVGMRILVYKGNGFVPVDIKGEMLGHVLGEFALTRTKVKHGSAGVGATKGTRALSKH